MKYANKNYHIFFLLLLSFHYLLSINVHEIECVILYDTITSFQYNMYCTYNDNTNKNTPISSIKIEEPDCINTKTHDMDASCYSEEDFTDYEIIVNENDINNPYIDIAHNHQLENTQERFFYSCFDAIAINSTNKTAYDEKKYVKKIEIQNAFSTIIKFFKKSHDSLENNFLKKQIDIEAQVETYLQKNSSPNLNTPNLKKKNNFISNIDSDIYLITLPFHERFLIINTQDAIQAHASIHQETAHKSYDENSKTRNLSYKTFGTEEFAVRDIFLASKVAALGNFTLPGTGFGSRPEDTYLFCLSPMQIKARAKSKEVSAYFDITFLHKAKRFKEVRFGITCSLPIIQKKHTLELEFKGGSLQCGAPMGGITGSTQTNITQFLSDFHSDIFDFFQRAILDPKELTYEKKQIKTGVGDAEVSLFVDTSRYNPLISTSVFGLRGVFPISTQQNGTIIWEPELGHKGAIQLVLFGLIESKIQHYLNPFIGYEALLAFPYHGSRRIPQEKDQNSLILKPERFSLHKISSFESLDSVIPEFSDRNFASRIHPGNSFYILVGNKFRHFGIQNMNVSLYYQYDKKYKDHVRALQTPKRTYHEPIIEIPTQHETHTIGWYAEYVHLHRLSLSFGSRHTVGGKYSTIKNRFYAGFCINL